MNNSHSASYAAAGVNIEAGYEGVRLMKQHVERTFIPGVVSDIGGFGGLFAPQLGGMKEPVLVSGTDGVGTKQRIAQLLDRHDTVGIDCVAMCVNDIVCCGAKPLFFLDYIAIGRNEPEKVATLVSGVAERRIMIWLASLSALSTKRRSLTGLPSRKATLCSGFLPAASIPTVTRWCGKSLPVRIAVSTPAFSAR